MKSIRLNIASLYFLTVLGVLLCSTPGHAQTTITVCASGCNHTTIQAAVNAVPSGSGAAGYTIQVNPGTYSGATLGTRSGTASNPFKIKAQYAARRPLDGAQWINGNNALRSIISGGTDQFNLSDPGTNTNLVFDGFYFTGYAQTAIHALNDSNIWIKNNVCDASAATTGEDNGCIALYFGGGALIQNNDCFVTAGAQSSDKACWNLWMTGVIHEYNSCRVMSGQNGKLRCDYFHTGNNDAQIRYNVIQTNAQCGTNSSGLCSRFRDSLRYNIHHNVWLHTFAQEHAWVHENTDSATNEAHQVHHNTFLFPGVESDFSAIGVEHIQGPSLVYNNIIQSTVNDTSSWGIGTSFSGSVPGTVTASNNLWWNMIALIRPTPSGVTDGGGNSKTNVTISTTTGCATAGASNATHGANLDIGQLPYRKCTDGTAYACAAMFGQSCTVNLGAGTPPGAPLDLRITSP